MELNEIKRGNIFFINLDPVIGSETGKIRPAVVVSNDINNKYSDTITVIPITSNTGKIYPFEVFLSSGTANLEKDSKIKANQLRTVDKKRLVRKIGNLEANIIKQIEKAILIHLGIN
jgi:mRNA interferase MazF